MRFTLRSRSNSRDLTWVERDTAGITGGSGVLDDRGCGQYPTRSITLLGFTKATVEALTALRSQGSCVCRRRCQSRCISIPHDGDEAASGSQPARGKGRLSHEVALASIAPKRLRDLCGHQYETLLFQGRLQWRDSPRRAVRVCGRALGGNSVAGAQADSLQILRHTGRRR